MVTKKLPTPRTRPSKLEELKKDIAKAKKKFPKKKVFWLDIVVSNNPPELKTPIATIHIYDGSSFVEMNDESLSVAKILTMVVSTVPMAIRDIIQRKIPDNNEVIERMLTRASAHTLRTGRTF